LGFWRGEGDEGCVRGMGNPLLDHPTLWVGARKGALGVIGLIPL